MPQPSHRETALDEQRCRNLLPTRPIGRMAFTERALPIMLPAHLVVRGEEIVLAALAALADGRVASAARRAVVAFEVDYYDPTSREGWCVSTLGRTRLITDAAQIAELDSLDFSPWADHPDRRYIAITIDGLHGKSLSRTPPSTPISR